MKQSPEKILQVRYGSDVIRVSRVSRRNPRPRVLIKVHPDCRVVVHAPDDASDAEVVTALRKRIRWVTKQIRSFRETSEGAMPRQFVSGECHYYLGRRYLLKVSEDPLSKGRVRLWRGVLEVSVPQKNQHAVRKLLEKWYRDRAKTVFLGRVEAMQEQALWVTEIPEVRIRSMSKQWGNCSPRGCLTLNIHLVKAPKEAIDYVILHELTHHLEHNHSERFYRMLDQVMPRWREVKERLDMMAPVLFSIPVELSSSLIPTN